MFPHVYGLRRAVSFSQYMAVRDKEKNEKKNEKKKETIGKLSAGDEDGRTRPKFRRGTRLRQLLTSPGPQVLAKKTISTADISNPTPLYPVQYQVPLTPLGEVSSTALASPFAWPSPATPTSPVSLLSHSAPASVLYTPEDIYIPEEKITLREFFLSDPIPSRAPPPSTHSPEDLYIPVYDKEVTLHNFCLSPKHSHSYTELERTPPHPQASVDRHKGLRRGQNHRRRHEYIERPSRNCATLTNSSRDESTEANATAPLTISPHSLLPPTRSPPPVIVAGPPQRFDSGIGETGFGDLLPKLSAPATFIGQDGESGEHYQSRAANRKYLSRISESSQEPQYFPGGQSNRKLKAIMEPIRASLMPPSNVGTKGRAIQQAKEMEQLVAERAKRSGEEPPQYDFIELIGKGAYGRVFKGKNRTSGSLVAIKIIDTDKADYEEMTVKNLSETLKEINILQQVKDSRAWPYVNIIEEARSVHNELWIISEYASGGSVNTLMKPRMQTMKTGIEEAYIIPIAREVAKGLKYIHEAGVIHRDLKCNNILITEDGRVQLCDFGVSGALEPEIAKRSTIVGTPFWMAPELQKEWVKEADPHSRVRPNEILYGSEVDIWAYGCTLFEMATGYPPFHETQMFRLPDAGIPQLEGDEFSDELKSLVSFVLQPDPRDRPSPDMILEHPYLADTVNMYPTETLVELVRAYYRWEQSGGSRISLFNPYGAQAPDPLAPEPEDGDEDWTFSTTDEFEKQFAGQMSDPFTSISSDQGFTGINPPPADEDRFARLQANIRAEQADRGQKKLGRLFDKDSTPYRYSAVVDQDPRRPPSDLILRDFNPGAPNRETVINLDFAAPTVADIPSIDLGEVPTVKANRLNRLMREMEMEDEERDSFDMDQTARRATRDWTFPSMPEQPKRATRDWTFPTMPEEPEPNRRTVDWKFPTMPEKNNRRTMEWTFDVSMAEANQEPLPKPSRLSRRRDTQEPSPPMATAPLEDNRRTRDFVFPMREPSEAGSLSDRGPEFASSPTLGPGFRPSLRHATTEPFALGTLDDYPRISSAPGSPRTSMIDLDMANIDDYRPTTAGSASTSTYTAGTETLNGNPFDLEDQVQLSQTNNRTSYHMKSQSEPNHAIPGLLTPQTYDEQGHPLNQDPHHPMHARGLSSVSQMQAKPPPNNIGYPRQRAQQPPMWEGWSHQDAFKIDESPPPSASPSTSGEEDSIDDRWDRLEKAVMQSQRRQFSGFRPRRTRSQDEDPRSDAEDNYASESYDDTPARISRVSVGPNGRPLVDFPLPRGPDPEALSGVDANPVALSNALWKSTLEMKEGLRASRDLLKSMRLAEMQRPGDEDGSSI